MAIPTLDQTEGIWIGRTNNQGYHYLQDIFSSETPREHYHQVNCRALITRGNLEPEFADGLAPAQRTWKSTLRYHRVHR